MYMSFATVEWKIIFRDSGSMSQSTLISNRYVGAGVLGGTLDLMMESVLVALIKLVLVELMISSIIPCWLIMMRGGCDMSNTIPR